MHVTSILLVKYYDLISKSLLFFRFPWFQFDPSKEIIRNKKSYCLRNV